MVFVAKIMFSSFCLCYKNFVFCREFFVKIYAKFVNFWLYFWENFRKNLKILENFGKFFANSLEKRGICEFFDFRREFLAFLEKFTLFAKKFTNLHKIMLNYLLFHKGVAKHSQQAARRYHAA